MTMLLPALVTCLALLLYLVVSIRVARARGQFGIDAPAIAGHPAFERIYRVQQNTLEQIVFFLPSLWLFATFVSPRWGAVLGALWIVGRLVYAISYYRDAASRGPGFIIAMVATLALFLGAFGAIIAGMVRGGFG